MRAFRQPISGGEIKLLVRLRMERGDRLRRTHQLQLKFRCVVVVEAIGQHWAGLRRFLLLFLGPQANAHQKRKHKTAGAEWPYPRNETLSADHDVSFFELDRKRKPTQIQLLSYITAHGPHTKNAADIASIRCLETHSDL